MDLQDIFGWFFTLIKSFVNFLDKKICLEFAGVKISYFAFVCAFFFIHILISAFIKSGGIKDD